MSSPRTLIGVIVAAAAAQLAAWLAAERGLLPHAAGDALLLLIGWALVLVLAVSWSRRIDSLSSEVVASRDRHQATLDEAEQTATLNDMLTTMGRSKDVGLTFQGLARRIGRFIPCDRLGLALMKEDGQQVQTFIARVSEPERRRRPRPEFEYTLDRSLFGQVIRTCEPVLIDDLGRNAADFEDATALASQGFKSALVLPLISRNRAIGALTIISRRAQAFGASERDALQPLAEVLAFAYLTQQQHQALEKFRTMETLAEMTVSLATDVNSALQAIVGQCGIIAQIHPEAAEDTDFVVQQAERISDLLERMRHAAHERLHEPAAAGGIPSSPEALADEDGFG